MTQVGYMQYFKFPTSLRSELLESTLLEWSSAVIHPCQMCWVLIMLMADMVDFPLPNWCSLLPISCPRLKLLS